MMRHRHYVRAEELLDVVQEMTRGGEADQHDLVVAVMALTHAVLASANEWSDRDLQSTPITTVYREH